MGTVNVGYLVSLAVFPSDFWLVRRSIRYEKSISSCSFRIYNRICVMWDSERYYILEYFSYYSRCWWGAFNTSWDGDVIPNIFTRGKAENFSVYCVANCCRTGSRTNYWWLFCRSNVLALGTLY